MREGNHGKIMLCRSASWTSRKHSGRRQGKPPGTVVEAAPQAGNRGGNFVVRDRRIPHPRNLQTASGRMADGGARCDFIPGQRKISVRFPIPRLRAVGGLACRQSCYQSNKNSSPPYGVAELGL